MKAPLLPPPAAVAERRFVAKATAVVCALACALLLQDFHQMGRLDEGGQQKAFLNWLWNWSESTGQSGLAVRLANRPLLGFELDTATDQCATLFGCNQASTSVVGDGSNSSAAEREATKGVAEVAAAVDAYGYCPGGTWLQFYHAELACFR